MKYLITDLLHVHMDLQEPGYYSERQRTDYHGILTELPASQLQLGALITNNAFRKEIHLFCSLDNIVHPDIRVSCSRSSQDNNVLAPWTCLQSLQYWS